MRIIHCDDPNFKELWTRGEKELSGVTIFYTNSFREYDRLMFGDKIVFDDSFLVLSQSSNIAALVPLYAFEVNDKIEYCYGPNAYLRGPLISSREGTRVFYKIRRVIINHI